MAVISNEIGRQIQDALGLKQTTRIEIILALNDVVRVNVTYYPDEESVKNLIPIFKQYKLTASNGDGLKIGV